MLHSEMEQRLQQLQQRVTSLRTESEEVWKTLETAEASLLEMLTAKDYDCSRYFGENAVPTSRPPETVQIKLRADRQETEEFYLTVSNVRMVFYVFLPPLSSFFPRHGKQKIRSRAVEY